MNILFGKFIVVLSLAIGPMLLLGFVTPFYYGHRILLQKMANFEDRKADAVFLGSSRTYRQLSPDILEERLPGIEEAVNLGAGGNLGIQNLYIQKEFIESGLSDGLRLIVAEFSLPDGVDAENATAIRPKYAMDSESLRLCLSYASSSALMSGEERFEFSKLCGRLWVERFLRIGCNRYMFYGMIKRFAGGGGSKRDGFEPFDLERSDFDSSLWARRESFIENLDQWRVDVASYVAGYDSHANEYSAIRAVVDYFEDLARVAKGKGIDLVVVYYPTPGWTNEEAYATFRAIEGVFKVDLSTPLKYPELYDERFYFDRGHLTREGAVILSEKVAAEIANQLSGGAI